MGVFVVVDLGIVAVLLAHSSKYSSRQVTAVLPLNGRWSR